MRRLAHCLLAGLGAGMLTGGLHLGLPAAFGLALITCAVICAIHSEATS